MWPISVDWGLQVGQDHHIACEFTVRSQRLSIQAKDLPAFGCSELTWQVACALSGHY